MTEEERKIIEQVAEKFCDKNHYVEIRKGKDGKTYVYQAEVKRHELAKFDN